MEDPYKILGVKKKASKEEIKKAYRRKAKETHPDVGGSTEDFQKTQKAFKILNDERARIIYDTRGAEEATENEKNTKAVALCTNVIERVLTELGINILTEDPFQIVQKSLTQSIIDNMKRKAEIVKTSQYLTKFMKRVKRRKTKHPDILQILIEESLIDAEGEIFALEEQNEITHIAKDIAEQYFVATPSYHRGSVIEAILQERLTARGF